MKLGMAVILLPSRPTNCFAFFLSTSVEIHLSANRRFGLNKDVMFRLSLYNNVKFACPLDRQCPLRFRCDNFNYLGFAGCERCGGV